MTRKIKCASTYPTSLVLAIALAVALLAPTFAAEAAEAEASQQQAWDLSDLFASLDAWEAERQALLEILPTLEAHQGKLGQDAKSLLAASDAISAFSKRLARLAVYAGLNADENLKIPETQERRGLAQSLGARFGQTISYVAPEILAVGAERIESFIAAEPGLAKHAFDLRDTLRQAPHILGQEAEQVMALTGDVTPGASRIYGILANSDVKWPTVTLGTGEEVTLSQAGYTKHRASQSRTDRKLVFDTFWSKWKDYENTFGQVLDTHVKSQVFNARARHYDSAVAASLDNSNVPVAVYYALIEAVNEGLPTLHRYFRLRQRMLGLDDLHYYDIYPDMVALEKSYSIADAKVLTLAAAEPLGDEYIDMLNRGFAGQWMHVFPQPGKRSGAYMSGAAYDVHPYLLLNFNSRYEDVSTFAHEWGHAVHSLLSRQNQPWETAPYSIFTAEIASNTTEVFLQENDFRGAATAEEKLFFLGSALEQMRASFYRQTMFAEFEVRIHETVEKGEALSGARMTQMYLELLRKYHGADEGVMEIDPLYAIEWAYIPHFYYNFYVFQYATSISGGTLFADKVLRGEEGAVDNYLDVLKAGGSRYPYELLKEAGIDMASKAPYEALIGRMNEIMDQIEALLEERG